MWCVCVGGAVGMACAGCELRWHLRTGRDIHWVVRLDLIIGSAEALPILCVRYIRWERERERERDTERDGSDVTIVALKLAMNLHVPLTKIRTIRHRFTLSLAKDSHLSFLPSHFPSLPSLRGHHCGAEIRNGFTLSVAKIFFALLVPTLSNGVSRATSDRKPKTNDQILPSPILCVRYFRWEREREREIQTERERRKWRHHCRAKIGDEFTL